MKKKVLLVISFLFLAVGLSSCDSAFFKKTYQVEFIDGENVIETKDVKSDELLDEPKDLIKEGYDFLGWYKDLNVESSKWDFKNDYVSSNLKLNAKWEVSKETLRIVNLRLVDSLLTWEATEETSYKISFLDEEVIISGSTFSLEDYQNSILEYQELTITPVKENSISVPTVIKVLYNKSEIIDFYRLDFENVPEISAGAYEKDKIINSEDHYFSINEAKRTSVKQFPKNDSYALLLRENGEIFLNDSYDNLYSLSFYVGNFDGSNKDKASNLTLYVKNLDSESWVKVKDYKTDANFVQYTVLETELKEFVDTTKPVTFRFADIGSKSNVIIDDIEIRIKTNEEYIMQYENNDIKLDEYYESAQGLKGEELVLELRTILNTNFNKVNYDDARYVLAYSDRDYLDEYKSVRGIYDGDKIATYWIGKGEGAWQREHVWPNSKLGVKRVTGSSKNQGSDLHNLRAITGINQTRSNRFFTSGNGVAVTVGSDAFYPGDEYKGDVARILLYMAVMYDVLSLTDSETLLTNNKETNYTLKGAYSGKISLLLTWHQEDPVDQFEKERNEFIYSGVATDPKGKDVMTQGNRNPFIDHPELFLEVINYFISIDNRRTISYTNEYLIEIDYQEFKKRYNKYIV
ncbi:MAG: endonuclease [Acholeplasma sp.]|nr:endonuclease [Acholeplasma sp.]